jgi:hypothetical protein
MASFEFIVPLLCPLSSLMYLAADNNDNESKGGRGDDNYYY